MNNCEKIEEVQQRIRALEREHGCTTLFASVCGSRAYGTDSNTSDCDTHFVYVYPQERYLAIHEPSTFLNAGDDVNGWDIRFFFRTMLAKSSWNVFEMLNSPMVVLGEENKEELKRLAYANYNPLRIFSSLCGCVLQEYKRYEQKNNVKSVVSLARLAMTLIVVEDRYSKSLPHQYPPVVFTELVEEVKTIDYYFSKRILKDLEVFYHAKKENKPFVEELKEPADRIVHYFTNKATTIKEKYKQKTYSNLNNLEELNKYVLEKSEPLLS